MDFKVCCRNASTSLPNVAIIELCIEGTTLKRINVNYLYNFGRVMQELHNVADAETALTPKEWADIATAKDWLENFGRSEMAPRTAAVTGEVWTHLNNLLKSQATRTEPLTGQERINLSQLVIKFTNVFESEAPEIFLYFVSTVGAYSLTKLIENACSHLSAKAQTVINDKQRTDFNLAGICLALDLYTASGFHAMRAVEEEARTYHKLVTTIDLTDVPLGALINGDSGQPGSGLKNQFVKEGSLNTSPLGLIISLLSHINKIYRVRIMHPDMTLDYESAKHLFDLSVNAITAIVEDGHTRFTAKQATGKTAKP